MPGYLAALVVVAIVGAGLVSGLLFAFSNFVVRALRDLPPESGMQAMQRINVTVLNPGFLAVFVGTTVGCVAIIVLCMLRLAAPGAPWLLAGGCAYLLGPFGVTALANVPLNNRLAGRRPAEAATEWPRYAAAWLRWNHVRTVAGAVSVAFLAIGLWASGR